MPELPDVIVFKEVATKTIDHKIKEVKVKDSHFVDLTRYMIDNHLENNRVGEVSRIGKYLFIGLKNDYVIVMHFGMTGNLEYLKTEADPPKFVKCTFELDNQHSLHYVSKRKLGLVEVIKDPGKYVEDLELGPDVLEIKKEDFMKKLVESSAMLKSFLMDQSKLCGIGNVYSDEILFQSRLHPGKKAREISDDDAETLFEEMHQVLKTAIEKNAEVSQFPDTFLLPVREKGASCPRCDGKIKKIKISGRSGYYCPSCQKK